jgi:hypothetical protein
MPKKRPTLKRKTQLSQMILSVGLMILVLVGLAATFILAQRTQDSRSDASTKKGLATIALVNQSFNVHVGDKVVVAVFLNSPVNIKKISMEGKFKGVKLSNADFVQVYTGYPYPSPPINPSPYPTAYPSVKPSAYPSPIASAYPSSYPTPMPSAYYSPSPIDIPIGPAGGGGNTSFTYSNEVTPKKFNIMFKSSGEMLMPARDNVLLGWLILTPAEAGELVIDWNEGDSKVIVHETGKDTLQKPLNFTTQVLPISSASPGPTISPLSTSSPRPYQP